MNKICPQCKDNIQMKLIPNSGREIGNYERISIFQKGTKTGIGAEYYACPNCGLVQQYVTEDSIEKLKDI